MAKDLLNRYIWLADLLKSHGRITREEISRRWEISRLGDGRPLPRRTFYSYRDGVEELFNVKIECDPHTYEYYIAEKEKVKSNIAEWLLDAVATNNLLSNSRDVADKIFVEQVPSAREYLAVVVDALKNSKKIKFSYLPYTRSIPTPEVVLDPYFLKIFRQRWYVTGYNNGDGKIKTYALDRMKKCLVSSENFTPDPAFDAEEYVRDSFGIVVTQNEPRKIVIQATPNMAKYLRSLPLHHSQEEMVHDRFSLFTYRMRVSRDLVEELLSHGSGVKVIEPRELRAMVMEELRASLGQYKK